jgi:predicted nucleotidyltransferase
MDLNELLQEKREAILELAAKHGACNVRVFGSVARHEANEQSDIDLLVDPMEHTSPWFPVGFIQDLEALLGRKVDVVTENGVYWLLRRRILKEARPL